MSRTRRRRGKRSGQLPIPPQWGFKCPACPCTLIVWDRTLSKNLCTQCKTAFPGPDCKHCSSSDIKPHQLNFGRWKCRTCGRTYIPPNSSKRAKRKNRRRTSSRSTKRLKLVPNLSSQSSSSSSSSSLSSSQTLTVHPHMSSHYHQPRELYASIHTNHSHSSSRNSGGTQLSSVVLYDMLGELSRHCVSMQSNRMVFLREQIVSALFFLTEKVFRRPSDDYKTVHLVQPIVVNNVATNGTRNLRSNSDFNNNNNGGRFERRIRASLEKTRNGAGVNLSKVPVLLDGTVNIDQKLINALLLGLQHFVYDIEMVGWIQRVLSIISLHPSNVTSLASDATFSLLFNTLKYHLHTEGEEQGILLHSLTTLSALFGHLFHSKPWTKSTTTTTPPPKWPALTRVHLNTLLQLFRSYPKNIVLHSLVSRILFFLSSVEQRYTELMRDEALTIPKTLLSSVLKTSNTTKTSTSTTTAASSTPQLQTYTRESKELSLVVLNRLLSMRGERHALSIVELYAIVRDILGPLVSQDLSLYSEDTSGRAEYIAMVITESMELLGKLASASSSSSSSMNSALSREIITYISFVLRTHLSSESIVCGVCNCLLSLLPPTRLKSSKTNHIRVEGGGGGGGTKDAMQTTNKLITIDNDDDADDLVKFSLKSKLPSTLLLAMRIHSTSLSAQLVCFSVLALRLGLPVDMPYSLLAGLQNYTDNRVLVDEVLSFSSGRGTSSLKGLDG